MGKAGAKLAALHSKYEDVINKEQLAALTINKVNSENNFQNKNHSDLYSQQLNQQNSINMKK